MNTSFKPCQTGGFYQLIRILNEIRIVIILIRSDFRTLVGYFTTTLYAPGRWPGHATRLNHDLTNDVGGKTCAAEELIAALTMAFLCAGLAIDGELRHASCISERIKLLHKGPRSIFNAAIQARQATDLLRALDGDREVDGARHPRRMDIIPSRPQAA